MGGVLLGFIIAFSGLLATLIVRWMAERPDPADRIPIHPDDLNREKPDEVCVDISYEYLDPVLESIEDTVDWGFSEAQRTSLVKRIVKLHRQTVTSAIFPIQYHEVPSDLVMQFMRVDSDVVRCRFQGNTVLMAKVRALLAKTPQKQITQEP